MSQGDLFRKAAGELLRGRGWAPVGGFIKGRLLWKEPGTGGLYEEEEAVKKVESEKKHEAQRSIPAGDAPAAPGAPDAGGEGASDCPGPGL